MNVKLKSKKTIAVRTKKKVKLEEHADRIKVQLDHKTMMVVHSMNAFKMWKKRYPLARIID
jgi:hypothetical protein